MTNDHFEIEIIYEDTHCIVLSKPSGLLSQGEIKGDPNLVDWLRNYLGRHYVGLIHRLDRNTSGIMVIAKRSKAATRLTQALQEGKICRAYLGYVCGNLKNTVKWTHRLEKDPVRNQVKAFPASSKRGKIAILKATPLKHAQWKGQPVTLVEFILETGRSHQIRAQAAKEGFPILGDAKYGGLSSFPRPALHSHRLSFPHPMTGEVLSFESEMLEDMRNISVG